MTRIPAFVHAQGSWGEIGHQVGTMLSPAIARHVEAWMQHIVAETGTTRERVLDTARRFADPIGRHAPFLAEELDGMAKGSRVPMDHLLLLQARAEVLRACRQAKPATPPLECTAFAACGRRTLGGEVLFGQNVDLVPFVEAFSVVIRQFPKDAPGTLLYTSAGLLGHNGLNEAGVGVCANFIDDPSGWGDGLPRDLLSRLALREDSAERALKTLLEPPRAASRNVLIADDRGVLLDAELLRTEAAVINGEDDLLVHANHLESPAFKGYETPTENSLCRRQRLEELLQSATASGTSEFRPLTVADVRGFYRDHAGAPHSLCAHPFPGRNIQTVVSVIGNLTARTLDVARGTPCQNPYATYTMATCRQGAQSVTVEELAGSV